MKKLFALVMAVACLAFAASANAAGMIKVGGGIYFDENPIGGMISVDIPVGEGGLAISPFGEVFYKDILKLYNGGVNVIMKRPAGENAKIYFGAGGGFSKVEIDLGIVSASSSEFMADGVAGIEFSVGESMAIFAQGKWIGTFGDAEARNFAAQAGIAFSFGE